MTGKNPLINAKNGYWTNYDESNSNNL